MRAWIASIALVLAVGFSTSALAQCCHGDKAQTTANAAAKGDEGGATCQKTACDKTACGDKSGAKAVASNMPLMQYKVGDQTVCCPKKASALAKGDESQIKYIVADKEYANKTEALQAYAPLLEQYLAKFTTVSYEVGDKCVNCPMAAAEMAKASGSKVQYKVGDTTFADQAKAEQAAKRAKDAVERVQMRMVVAGKAYTCQQEAAQACKDGKKCEYQVGDTKTNCPVTAKVELAKARIDEARKVVEEEARA